MSRIEMVGGPDRYISLDDGSIKIVDEGIGGAIIDTIQYEANRELTIEEIISIENVLLRDHIQDLIKERLIDDVMLEVGIEAWEWPEEEEELEEEYGDEEFEGVSGA